MPRKPLPMDQVLSLLRNTPARIAEITTDLSLKQLHTPQAPDKWSANEVLAHLRACADVWGDCIRKILAEDTPTIRAVNPRTWIKQTNHLEREFPSSLRAFKRQRRDLLAILETLTAEDWNRKAIITGAGAVLEHPVLSYATRLAVHERAHLKQFQRIADTMRKKRS